MVDSDLSERSWYLMYGWHCSNKSAGSPGIPSGSIEKVKGGYVIILSSLANNLGCGRRKVKGDGGGVESYGIAWRGVWHGQGQVGCNWQQKTISFLIHIYMRSLYQGLLLHKSTLLTISVAFHRIHASIFTTTCLLLLFHILPDHMILPLDMILNHVLECAVKLIRSSGWSQSMYFALDEQKGSKDTLLNFHLKH